MTSLKERRASLESRLKELDERLREIEDALVEEPSKDWEELAIEREDDEVLEGVGLSAQAEVAMIKAALNRMDEGTYGECARCGEQISKARLDVLPFTPLCRECAAGAG